MSDLPGLVGAIIMIPTALSAQMGGVVNPGVHVGGGPPSPTMTDCKPRRISPIGFKNVELDCEGPLFWGKVGIAVVGDRDSWRNFPAGSAGRKRVPVTARANSLTCASWQRA